MRGRPRTCRRNRRIIAKTSQGNVFRMDGALNSDAVEALRSLDVRVAMEMCKDRRDEAVGRLCVLCVRRALMIPHE